MSVICEKKGCTGVKVAYAEASCLLIAGLSLSLSLYLDSRNRSLWMRS